MKIQIINILIACTYIFLFIPSFSQTNRKLLWSDEFNYTGFPDSNKWSYEEGFVRNQEPQYYTKQRKENVWVENGNLVITAKLENFKNSKYTSGSINTLYHADWDHGRIEVRAKVPKGIGSWPAIWMMGVNFPEVKWPKCGEIDIMEFIGRDSNSVYGTVHYIKDSGKYEFIGKHPIVGKPYEGYHIYAVDWNKEKIKFYYDSLEYFVFDLKKADESTKKIFSQKFYLLLNLALGNEGTTLAGKLEERILPIRFYVDYVRVYE
ncbi:MAG: glycoside hydrolase family 16 protein [Arachidicoccus sp.]|nr:glycoside hydrolase family 16 protein [Arachidicoccus sp.]